ncbi:hypothetical protein FNL39_108150 [Nocardia caishijiensis]|uniref:Isopenicillin N synthase-like dioxygenase n=1 Tax=Nocardia caishijiensis TaxID=184756 RepID=A0ABQ6YHS5_9NOCA|nr:hypothetical protein FNL39_108150 [Nocardia caishijiensis]
MQIVGHGIDPSVVTGLTDPANTWPEIVPDFRTAVESWFGAARTVSRALLVACCDALGLAPGHFDTMTDHFIDALKMNNYALPDGEIDVAEELTGMGAHTDFGILTPTRCLACKCSIRTASGTMSSARRRRPAGQPGRRDGTVDQRPLAFDRPPGEPASRRGRILRRRFAAFFFDGNHDAVIETLPGCAHPDRPGYPPITVADDINAKLAGMKSGIAPQGTADREAARVLAATGG